MAKFTSINFNDPYVINNGGKIWNFLMNKYKNEMGVAGMMGNLYAESHQFLPISAEQLDNQPISVIQEYTNQINNGTISKEQFYNYHKGYGIAQWTYWGRKKALYELAQMLTNPFNIGDMNVQLTFMVNELHSYGCDTELMYSTDIKSTANYIMNNYEKPSWRGDFRARWAVECYNYWSGKNYVPQQEYNSGTVVYIQYSGNLFPGNYKINYTKYNANNTTTIATYYFTLENELPEGKFISFDFNNLKFNIDSTEGNLTTTELENAVLIEANGDGNGNINSSFMTALVNNAVDYNLRSITYQSISDMPKWFQPTFIQLSNAGIIDIYNYTFNKKEMRALVWLQNSLIKHGELLNTKNKQFNYEV